ncbi:hypothetical protein [Candidatus Harpocratesius sp.]
MKINLTYREVQEELKRKFGSGVSNTTLQKIQEEISEIVELRAENNQLKQELAMYKNLYFELLDVMKKKLEK